jgi:hypothetical protein
MRVPAAARSRDPRLPGFLVPSGLKLRDTRDGERVCEYRGTREGGHSRPFENCGRHSAATGPPPNCHSRQGQAATDPPPNCYRTATPISVVSTTYRACRGPDFPVIVRTNAPSLRMTDRTTMRGNAAQPLNSATEPLPFRYPWTDNSAYRPTPLFLSILGQSRRQIAWAHNRTYVPRSLE